jgi:hypothetical protein
MTVRADSEEEALLIYFKQHPYPDIVDIEVFYMGTVKEYNRLLQRYDSKEVHRSVIEYFDVNVRKEAREAVGKTQYYMVGWDCFKKRIYEYHIACTNSPLLNFIRKNPGMMDRLTDLKVIKIGVVKYLEAKVTEEYCTRVRDNKEIQDHYRYLHKKYKEFL